MITNLFILQTFAVSLSRVPGRAASDGKLPGFRKKTDLEESTEKINRTEKP